MLYGASLCKSISTLNCGRLTPLSVVLETLSKAAETLCSIISLFDDGFKYPYNIIEKTWKKILLNQFHDILPGSSIIEVYDDVHKLWQECYQDLNKLIENCLERIKTERNNNIIFYNPLPWERSGRVFIPLNEINSKIELDKEIIQAVIDGSWNMIKV